MTALAPLWEAAELIPGRIPPKTADSGDGLRYFGIPEISGRPPRVLEPGTDLKPATYLRAGDVVVALAGELGRSAIVDDSQAGAVLGRECAALRIKTSGQLLPSWLHAWTKSQHFRSQVDTRSRGSTQPRLSIAALAEFVLPIPGLSAQAQFAATTERLDAVLRSASALIRDVEDLRQADVDLAIANALGS